MMIAVAITAIEIMVTMVAVIIFTQLIVTIIGIKETAVPIEYEHEFEEGEYDDDTE